MKTDNFKPRRATGSNHCDSSFSSSHYRGVPVIGAWQWFDDLGFGIVTEIDHAEAFRPLSYLRWAFGAITMMLASCVGLLIVSTGKLKKMRRQVEVSSQLGQYSLEEKIGEGGMGSVYRARHALLKRPTAVKLLQPENLASLKNEVSSGSRFEKT